MGVVVYRSEIKVTEGNRRFHDQSSMPTTRGEEAAGSCVFLTRRNMVSELPGMLRCFPRCAPASPPNAKPISRRVSCSRKVNFTRGNVNEGKRSAKILRTQVLSWQ